MLGCGYVYKMYLVHYRCGWGMVMLIRGMAIKLYTGLVIVLKASHRIVRLRYIEIYGI